MRPALLTLLAVTLTFAGCRKPAPLVDELSPATAPEPESAGASAIETHYRSLTDPADRFDAINALGSSPAPEAVTAIGRLLHFERDPELRSALIEALSDIDEEIPAKLAIVGPLVGNPTEPEEVREAALDCLDLIEDRAAIPVWQKLINHPDETVREIAHARLEELADLPAE